MSIDTVAAEMNLHTQTLGQVLGIDLGGSAIKLGRFNQDGHCLQALTVPTPFPAAPDAVLVAMVDAIAQIDPE
jgi:glucokinase